MFVKLFSRRGRKYTGVTCRNCTAVSFFVVQLQYRFAIVKTTQKLLVCVDKTSFSPKSCSDSNTSMSRTRLLKTPEFGLDLLSGKEYQFSEIQTAV
jgi:hypothetical protein